MGSTEEVERVEATVPLPLPVGSYGETSLLFGNGGMPSVSFGGALEDPLLLSLRAPGIGGLRSGAAGAAAVEIDDEDDDGGGSGGDIMDGEAAGRAELLESRSVGVREVFVVGGVVGGEPCLSPGRNNSLGSVNEASLQVGPVRLLFNGANKDDGRIQNGSS